MSLKHYGAEIEAIISSLGKLNLLEEVSRDRIFNDEPRFFNFAAKIRLPDLGSNNGEKDVITGGSSPVSQDLALLKCLVEGVERASLFYYSKKSITFGSYNKTEKICVDPNLFYKKNIRNKKMGWVKGFKLGDNNECLIPAQLVYLLYEKLKGEPKLQFPNVSTGAAGGLDHETTLLNAIYEVIERDSFMAIYLNKIKAPRVDLGSVNSETLWRVLKKCKRYNLEVYVFNITTDVNIPSFLAVTTDRTGVGPAVLVGAKASLNEEEAIIGAIMESLAIRSSARLLKFAAPNGGDTNRAVKKRILFWYDTSKIKKLDFLIKQPQVKYKLEKHTYSKTQELDKVLKLLSGKNLEGFYADITLPGLRKTGCIVYKVIIPGLQPLYLDERDRIFTNLNRLKQVAKYFHSTKFNTNKILHPFT